MSPIRSVLFAATAATLVAGCSSSTSPNSQRVNLAFAGIRPAGAAPAINAALMANVVPGPSDSLVIVNGTDTLIITKVEVVARKIELKGATATDCDNAAQMTDCEELQLDTRLLRLPLAAGVSTSIGTDVPDGTYDGFDLHFHKPTTSSGDAAFIAANPTWPLGTSVRVTGFFRSVAFVYTTDVVFKVEQDFTPALVVAAGTTTNVTIRIDVASWFRNGAGGPLINPATAGSGGANKSLVEQNIQNSVRGFKDDNQDGNELNG